MPVGLVTVYTATALLGTALFFFLHYLGNQIPYELAQRRFADEFEANRPEMERFNSVVASRHDIGSGFGDCQIALAIVAGAHRDAAYHPLVDAVLMKSFKRRSGNYCPELRAASLGLELEGKIEKTRYWWGQKALSAIALRFLSVPELYRLVLVAGFGAWLLLAAAVAPMGWWALLAVGPVVVFGMAFSGIVLFADLAHGISYSWAVLAAAILALLLRWPATARWAPWFCFVTGMASSYLWFFDGHTSLALALIGLVAWLGYGRSSPGGATRRAAGCVAPYAAGFAVCYALGQVTKAVVHEWSIGGNDYLSGWVAGNFLGKASRHWDRMVREATTTDPVAGCVVCGDGGAWHNLPIIRELIDFFLLLTRGIDLPVAMVVGVFSVLALASAAAVAIRQARRGRWELAGSILWMGALALLVLAHFFLPNDVAFRKARFVFLLLAMCWICLVLAMMQLDRRGSSILAGCLVGGLLAGVAAVEPAAEWLLDRTLATTRHVIRSDFDVYLDKDDGRLIYVKDECGGADIESVFVLHLTPVDYADLPERHRRHTYHVRNFRGEQHHAFSTGGRCFLVRSIPDWDIAAIRTGVRTDDEGWIWRGSAVLIDESAITRALANARLLIRSDFDVYLDKDDNRLIYVKDECSGADIEPTFFLHLMPVDRNDLPGPRRRHGSDVRDFVFSDHGTLTDGRCVAMRFLPHYEVAVIRTGQYVPPSGPALWDTEIDVEE